MDSISQNKTAIQSLLAENSTIGIIVSEHQSLDVLASAVSLQLILQDSGKNSQIVSRAEPTVEHSFLVGIDQIAKSFSGSTKTLTVSFPYHDGDIEKVSYNIEGDRLNVNLFAEEQGIRFTEKDIKYIREGSAPQLVITIGITNPQELEGIVDQSAKVINIDNTVANALFGTVQLVDPAYSSLSEMVAKIALELGLQVEFDVAQNLLDGIAFATQNFTSPKTSPIAFEMVGALMQKGAKRKPLNEVRSTTDTSLSMLNNKQQPKSFAQAPFASSNFPKQQRSQTNGMPQQFDQNPFSAQAAQPTQEFQPEPYQSFQHPQQSQQQAPIAQANESVLAPQDNLASDTIPQVPSEDEAPSDWFTPKVFKSTKNQG